MNRRNRNYSTGIKRAFQNYTWWTYSSMLNFERAIWKDWEKIYSERKIPVSSEGHCNYIVKISKLAIKLLDMMDETWIEFEEPLKIEKSSERGFRKFASLKPNFKKGVYVNTRNFSRFFPLSTKESFDEKDAYDLSELRKKKVWHLYNLLREYKLEYCWD